MIADLMVTFWQPVVVGILIIIGFLISKFDGQGEDRVGFEYMEVPVMKPIKICTADKGFWKAIWMWLTGVRRWQLTEDFFYFLHGEEYVIEKGFEFDGASVPKFLAVWLSPVGVLLMGGLVHDYGYKYAELVKTDNNTVVPKTKKELDILFRDICIEVNGFKFLNYLAYWTLRLAGFVAWNGHKKRGTHVKETT